jgi:hypothetical protein
MSAERQFWTAQETELAQSLIAQGASDEMFRSLMGRTKKCAESRLRRVNDHSFGMIKAISNHYAGEGNIKVPPEVIEDRNRRLMARMQMDLTGALMNDPPKGFSALERRA